MKNPALNTAKPKELSMITKLAKTAVKLKKKPTGSGREVANNFRDKVNAL
jgi:hypothetical protein